jgi:hypothetical protein
MLFSGFFFFPVTFEEQSRKVPDRFIRVARNMELAERAAGDYHFSPGFLNLISPALAKCCCFIREPRSDTASRPATDGRHFSDVRNAPEYRPWLLCYTLSPGKVAGVMVCHAESEVGR